ncbi:MAG: glycosyltransferase [Methanobacterium sp.]|uniref:CgeB family protein n=1 Tax=Methanobacterium sp. TaxID=2164 RepID=UPI003C71D29B
MNKFFLKLKLKFSKNNLRQFKNSFNDEIDSIKYDTTLIKHRVLNPSSVTPNNESKKEDKSFKVAIAVTESGKDASAGDYFTALELGEALEKFGWEISFLPRNGRGYWYEVDANVDVLISMLDNFDPRRIRSSNNALIKIAWPRNWFDRWVSNHGFKNYDIILAPSKISIEYIKERSDKKPILFPIATNQSRFNKDITPKNEYLCDYCFTGSYWNNPRDIMEMLEPEHIPYEFKLFGKNWEKIDKFKKYYQGFVSYFNMPKVYASTKIVIDDANHATKKYGAVNSRVFDALACGTLVLTNGKKGAEDTFKGKLPVFNTKMELNHLIEYYLSNPDLRTAKIGELQNFVLLNHTYTNRADIIKEKLDSFRNQ